MVRLAGVSALVGLAATAAGSPFSVSPDSAVKDTCGGATFYQMEQTNAKVRPIIQDLVTTDYFRYYKVDLSPTLCPFSDDDLGMCGNRACAVEVLDDEREIPEFWRAQYLGALAEDSVRTERMWSTDDDSVANGLCNHRTGSTKNLTGEICERDRYLDSELEDKNYCYPEDESLTGPGVYVSLPDNPERFTGYGGPHANKVWRAVYQENCFGYFGDNGHMRSSPAFSSHHLPLAGSKLSSVVMDSNRHERQEVGGEAGRQALNIENQCVEQRLFYRILSGFQSSISAHLCYEYLNQTSGEWSPNQECFVKRVGNHPERLENLYFNYALVSRAVSKLRNYIDDLHFNHEDKFAEQNTRRQLLKLIKSATPGSDRILFNETAIFSSPEGRSLKSEFRKRVRNVSALMSCVGCDRCRLWGKLQTAGYGTALKLLFELPEKPADDPDLCSEVMSTFRRSELVALVNTFDRLSKSVEAVEYFRRHMVVKQPSNGKLLQSEWDKEFTEAWKAIKFVLRSYIDFPKNLWTLFVHYSNIYWNKFIGRGESPLYRRSRIDL
jgi:ERO1-like protein beta